MKTKKVLLVAVFALLGAFNAMTIFAKRIPVVIITCDQPQAGHGQCFEPFADPDNDCLWTGRPADYC